MSVCPLAPDRRVWPLHRSDFHLRSECGRCADLSRPGADQIDRVRKLADPDTRQFSIDALQPSSASEDLSSSDLSVNTEPSDDSSDESVAERIKRSKEKKKPGKLPENFKQQLTDNSRDAADNALKRFFGGGS